MPHDLLVEPADGALLIRVRPGGAARVEPLPDLPSSPADRATAPARPIESSPAGTCSCLGLLGRFLFWATRHSGG